MYLRATFCVYYVNEILVLILIRNFACFFFSHVIEWLDGGFKLLMNDLGVCPLSLCNSICLEASFYNKTLI